MGYTRPDMTATADPTMDRRLMSGGRAPCGHLTPCGCRYAPCCFACPLTACRYDAVALGVRDLAVVDRNSRIRGARAAGASIATLIATFGISRRHAFRITAGHRAATQEPAT